MDGDTVCGETEESNNSEWMQYIIITVSSLMNSMEGRTEAGTGNYWRLMKWRSVDLTVKWQLTKTVKEAVFWFFLLQLQNDWLTGKCGKILLV